MKRLLLWTTNLTKTLTNLLIGPCPAEQRMLAIRERARVLREFGSCQWPPCR
jgi:hypothetical protein